VVVLGDEKREAKKEGRRNQRSLMIVFFLVLSIASVNLITHKNM
jgi:predicted nucleic acid-binding Zn ribbon protein